jgi:hypothetical protein
LSVIFPILRTITQDVIINVGRSTFYGEMYTVFWWGNPRERDQLEDLGVDGRILLRLIFRKCDVAVWNGSIWLRIGTRGGPL